LPNWRGKRLRQCRRPSSAAPSPAGGPSALPQPLTSPVGQITQQQLQSVLANPWVPAETKTAMLNMIQQRGQVQSFKVPGGTLQVLPGTGQQSFIPEEVPVKIKSAGGTEIEGRGVYDPTSGRYHVQTLLPEAPQNGAPPAGTSTNLAHPALAQPDLSSMGAIEANDVAQAGAKKAAEAGGEANAKYLDSLKKGVLGTAMIASQQKQNLDALNQVANSPDLVTGTFGDAALGMQRMAAGLGINPTGAAPRELFNMLSSKILGDQISGLKTLASETGEVGGRIFKPMLDIEEKSNITPEDSIEGVKAKLNLFNKMGDLAIHYGQMADDYILKHGSIDENFDHQLREEIAKSRLPDVVPQPAQPTGAVTSGAAPTGPAPSDIEAEMRKRGLLK